MVRHLTSNTPRSDEGTANPFAQDEVETSESPPSRTYATYDSPNGTTANLLSNESSSSEDYNNINNTTNTNISNLRGDSNNNLNAGWVKGPAEYDRFPSRIGSRVVSSSSLNSMGYRMKNGKIQQDSNEDMKSNNTRGLDPFMLETYDFSPFGGYPASSFPLHIDEKEPDDYLHNPDPIEDAAYDRNRFKYDLKNLDRRSLGGLLGVIALFLGAIGLFVVLPLLTYSNINVKYTPESYEILTQYEYPTLSALRSLVDPDTPSDVLTKTVKNGDSWTLVFSDEFNVEGRTFYDGDDQFWQAVDIWYAGTKDLEWYDPDAASTENGTLNLRMDAYKNHDLFYRSGMVQSWNKFCFTQGMLEISARLPNYGNVSGLWPGLWSMGNLGRPGYMASTEGVWPYTYDSCDAGITPNQSSPDGISYLPGQKLNSCTCKNADHPNPGTGRGAPEIDAIEAETDTTKNVGVASQSMQIAPMDIWYMPDYSFLAIHNASVTTVNTYAGGPIQQAVSGTTTLNSTWYQYGSGLEHNFQTYGFEYLNDDDDGYVTWYVGEPTLTVHAYALAPNGNIGWRRISKEPMSIVLNLGISNNWAYIDWAAISFPVTFSIDFVRVYQPEDDINVTCDPSDFPTYDYIQSHLNAYSNNNLTGWEQAGYSFPKNTLVGC
ncbi:beta-glucan synthesis-associated protein Kre6p [[Candida] railenensis]|uniref:Beta-glucan synthesis-associated protein Kre6p n=1 Tax=[Candida] railenensis TaxID=45579 RepID=A0A9P0VZ60_9ASCO|nr:beta-glucan synthesis-associated protein Kre6p [[Candida] railenensis]